MSRRTLAGYGFTAAAILALCLSSNIGPRTILVALIAALGCAPALQMAIVGRGDPLSARVLVPLTYTLYALGPLIEPNAFSPDIYTMYLALQLVGLVALRTGLRVAARWSRPAQAPTPPTRPEPTRAWAGLLAGGAGALVLLAAVSIASQASAFGGLKEMLTLGYGAERYRALRQATTFGAGLEWLLLGGVVLAFHGVATRRRATLVSGLAVYALGAWLALSIGARGGLVYSLLFSAVLWHYGHRRLAPRAVLVALVLGIVASQFISILRYYLTPGVGTAVVQAWEAVRQNPKALLPLGGGEFVMPGRSTLEVLADGGPGLLWGRSYVGALGAPFPVLARLLADASFDPSAWRLRTFYPEMYTAGGGLGFALQAEALINFGVLGIPACCFLYGYAIGRLHGLAAARPSLALTLLYAGSLPMFLLDGLRIHAASFTYKWTRAYLMPWLLVCLASFARRAASFSAAGRPPLRHT